MLGNFIPIPQDIIERAVKQIEQWHRSTHDEMPSSLVWALAHEAIAQQIRVKLTQQQINISGIDLEIHPDAVGD